MKLFKLIVLPHLSSWLMPAIQLNPFHEDFFLGDVPGIDWIKGGLNFLGGYMGMEGQKEINKENIQYQREFAKRGLGWKIEDAARYGIHPLAAIGATPTPMPTIPMQNPMAHMSSALQNIQMPDSGIDKALKMYALDEARRRAQDAKYDYEILIPVKHPHMPGKTLWAFNSRYLAYGSFPTMLVMAANKDVALNMLREQLSPEENSVLDKTIKHLKQYDKKRKTKALESPKLKTPIYDDMGGAP
jgi:hypothetical protein